MTRTLSMPKVLWWGVDIASFACWIAVIARSFGPAYGLPGAPISMDTHGPFGSAYLLPIMASIVFLTLTLAPLFLVLANRNGARTPAKIATLTATLRILKLAAMLMLVFSVDSETYTFRLGAALPQSTRNT